nr:hypothetical protein Iba_chr12cCG0190 [Ipomoea batatas]
MVAVWQSLSEVGFGLLIYNLFVAQSVISIRVMELCRH